jgi:hypothetical protein
MFFYFSLQKSKEFLEIMELQFNHQEHLFQHHNLANQIKQYQIQLLISNQLEIIIYHILNLMLIHNNHMLELDIHL